MSVGSFVQVLLVALTLIYFVPGNSNSEFSNLFLTKVVSYLVTSHSVSFPIIFNLICLPVYLIFSLITLFIYSYFLMVQFDFHILFDNFIIFTKVIEFFLLSVVVAYFGFLLKVFAQEYSTMLVGTIPGVLELSYLLLSSVLEVFLS